MRDSPPSVDVEAMSLGIIRAAIVCLSAMTASVSHAQPSGPLRCPEHATGTITRSGNTVRLHCECDADYMQVGKECVLSVSRVGPPECMSSARPSCDVYDRCFERVCNCESTPDRYFLSYGKKYCERFLHSIQLSSSGQRWRDKTLVCLQEAIVPHLPLNASQCNCGDLKNIAFRAHVTCYTQADASICDLGADDWLKIYNIVDREDQRMDEMLAVAHVCLDQIEQNSSVRSIVQRIVEQLVIRSR